MSGNAIVIGAGPVGLFAVFALGMVGIKATVLDALPALGGQCAALYPEKPIYDIPGFPEISGADLVDRLALQAKPFEPVYHLNQRADKLTPLPGGGWRVETQTGQTFETPVVVVAAGTGAFGPKRPPLDGIERFEGVSVHYLVKRASDFAGARVAIAGGGDSALDWAVLLAEVAAKVWLIHRRAQFRAAESSVAKMQALVQAGKIELVAPGQLAGLEGQGSRLTGVVVDDLAGHVRTLDAQQLLCFFGLLGDLGPLSDWGLALDDGRIKADPASMATNLPGVFAIGDIALYPGKLKLILSGFAEAALAARAAYAILHPGQALHEVHSTSRGVPGTTPP